MSRYRRVFHSDVRKMRNKCADLFHWVLLLLATVRCSGRSEAEQHTVRVAAEHRGDLGAEQRENHQPARTRRGRTKEQSCRVWGTTQRTQQRNRRLPAQRGLSDCIARCLNIRLSTYYLSILTRSSLILSMMLLVSGFNSRCRTFVSVCNQPATQGQLSLPSLRGR